MKNYIKIKKTKVTKSSEEQLKISQMNDLTNQKIKDRQKRRLKKAKLRKRNNKRREQLEPQPGKQYGQQLSVEGSKLDH